MRFWTVLAVASGCVRESDVLVESEPVAWRFDPAAPTGVTVAMQAVLTVEAGPWARLNPLETEAFFTFEEPVPDGLLTVTQANSLGQEVALGPAELELGLSTTCSPAEWCTSNARIDLELPEGSGPVDATVQASMWMGGRWRDTDADVWTEVSVSVEE